MKKICFMAILIAIFFTSIASAELIIDVRSMLDGGPVIEARKLQFGADKFEGGATYTEVQTFLDAAEKLAGNDKHQKILVVCNAGVRSKEAQIALELAGFDRVHSGKVFSLLQQGTGLSP